MINKRETAGIFRERLLVLIERRNETVSAFAKRCRIDRSALSQFLDTRYLRLPRAETLSAIAKSENVSIDWILGISQDDETVSEVLSLMDVEAGFSGAEDSPMASWHRDAIGYKIRYVPTTLPDLLRTEKMIEYERPQHKACFPA